MRADTEGSGGRPDGAGELGSSGASGRLDALGDHPKLRGEESPVPRIEIYTKTFCGYCWRAKHLLESKGVTYHEISVDFGGEVRSKMIDRANGRTTVPQIFIRGLHIGGYDDLFALEQSGDLDSLITV